MNHPNAIPSLASPDTDQSHQRVAGHGRLAHMAVVGSLALNGGIAEQAMAAPTESTRGEHTTSLTAENLYNLDHIKPGDTPTVLTGEEAVIDISPKVDVLRFVNGHVRKTHLPYKVSATHAVHDITRDGEHSIYFRHNQRSYGVKLNMKNRQYIRKSFFDKQGMLRREPLNLHEMTTTTAKVDMVKYGAAFTYPREGDGLANQYIGEIETRDGKRRAVIALAQAGATD